MPFEIVTQQFGSLSELLVRNSISGDYFIVVPQCGGVVRKLNLTTNGTAYSILKVPETPEELINDNKSASELLFPFASRIAGGKYAFQGKEYHLVKNENGGLNAIHGLVRKHSFQIVDQQITLENVSVKLGYLITQPTGYPFDIQLFVTYSLSCAGTFELAYEANNIGINTAPVMFGWHPYFQLGNESVDNWKIKIPSTTLIQLDEHLIPIGSEDYQEEGATSLLGKELDSCFKVNAASNYTATELIAENQNVTLILEQETGESNFHFLVIFTPAERDCIAIEPLTGNVNCFNNGDGLNILPPGASIRGAVRLRLT